MTQIIEFGYISETYYAKGERNTLLLLTAGIKPGTSAQQASALSIILWPIWPPLSRGLYKIDGIPSHLINI